METKDIFYFSTVTGEHSSYAATGGRGKKNTCNSELWLLIGVVFRFIIILTKWHSKIIKVYHVSDTLLDTFLKDEVICVLSGKNLLHWALSIIRQLTAEKKNTAAL